MTLKKLMRMWRSSHSTAEEYYCEIYRTDNGKETFLMLVNACCGMHELKDGLKDREVTRFAVTETKLTVVLDVYKRGVDAEYVSLAEFYSLIDKSCIDLDGSERWLEEMKDDREECIKYFEFNPKRDELLLTYAKIPHCPM